MTSLSAVPTLGGYSIHHADRKWKSLKNSICTSCCFFYTFFCLIHVLEKEWSDILSGGLEVSNKVCLLKQRHGQLGAIFTCWLVTLGIAWVHGSVNIRPNRNFLQATHHIFIILCVISALGRPILLQYFSCFFFFLSLSKFNTVLCGFQLAGTSPGNKWASNYYDLE